MSTDNPKLSNVVTFYGSDKDGLDAYITIPLEKVEAIAAVRGHLEFSLAVEETVALNAETFRLVNSDLPPSELRSEVVCLWDRLGGQSWGI